MRAIWPVVFFIFLPFIAAADDYSPPAFLFDVKAGDNIEKVTADQGWYECDQGTTRHLCYDGITTLGETGRFTLDFINNKAISARLVVEDVGALRRMIERLPTWRGGNHTLVYIRTDNAEIDIIKAVHDLGEASAKDRFSRYLKGDSQHLQGITLVPLSPPSERQHMNAEEYLNHLPKGGVILSLSSFRFPLDVTVFSLSLPLADKKELFPEFCRANCSAWSVPLADNGPAE